MRSHIKPFHHVNIFLHIMLHVIHIYNSQLKINLKGKLHTVTHASNPDTQGNAPQLSISPILWKDFLSGGSLLSDDLSSCPVDTKLSGVLNIVTRTYNPSPRDRRGQIPARLDETVSFSSVREPDTNR